MSNIIYKIWNPASPSPSPVKVDPLNIESQNQVKNIPVVHPTSPMKIRGKSVMGCLSSDRTYKIKKNKKTEITILCIYDLIRKRNIT